MSNEYTNVSEAERLGVAGYSRAGLAIYDALVYGVTSPYFWDCPGHVLLAHYNRHISNNHLDVGVGTGYMLDHCTFTSPSPRICLLDLSPNPLAKTARRIARYRPRTIQGSVLSPIPFDGEPFDSIGTNYMIHCVPGSIPEKAVLFDHLGALLAPSGVIFGSTVLGEGVPTNSRARWALPILNQKGTFSNLRDNEADLRRALETRFDDVSMRVVGMVALFSARKRAAK